MSIRALTTLAVAFVLGASAAAQKPPSVPDSATAPAVTHYKLRFALDLEKHELSGKSDITIENTTAQPMTSVPILLYRLMDVQSTAAADGKPLPFTQKITKFPDEPTWQANAVAITIPPLAPGRSTVIHLEYAGPLLGYREVMQYVRDTVGEDYSLIRAETMAYPIVGVPAYAGWSRSYKNSYDYEVKTLVPVGYVAVCSGNSDLTGQPVGNGVLFRCTGEPGSSQIDVAVAKFQVYDDSARHLRVYAMPADADAGKRILGELQGALEFFTSYYGPRECLRYGGGACTATAHASGLKLVEIPDGWGSYATVGTIFQAAAAFKDPQRAPELYHEVGHLWNAKPIDTIQRTRYFDEAFASYAEALAVRHFSGEAGFRSEMEDDRKYFASGVAKEPRGKTTAIADYGKYEIGGFSYTKGAWSLHVLHEILGDDAFRRAIAQFLNDYSEKPATFEGFLASLERSSGKDLKLWYQQWIVSAEPSSTMLLEGKTVEEMAAQCRATAPPAK